jgi:hypothetical protein
MRGSLHCLRTPVVVGLPWCYTRDEKAPSYIALQFCTHPTYEIGHYSLLSGSSSYRPGPAVFGTADLLIAVGAQAHQSDDSCRRCSSGSCGAPPSLVEQTAIPRIHPHTFLLGSRASFACPRSRLSSDRPYWGTAAAERWSVPVQWSRQRCRAYGAVVASIPVAIPLRFDDVTLRQVVWAGSPEGPRSVLRITGPLSCLAAVFPFLTLLPIKHTHRTTGSRISTRAFIPLSALFMLIGVRRVTNPQARSCIVPPPTAGLSPWSLGISAMRYLPRTLA